VTSPDELRVRAGELEGRVPPLAAGPRTDDERLVLEKAGALRDEADRLEAVPAEREYVPGSSGSLLERITEVIENEVPGAYARLAVERAGEVVGAWQHDAVERARAQARSMFAGLMPGATGTNMADEVADKVLAAAGLLPPG
jgi:hypothetical protein